MRNRSRARFVNALIIGVATCIIAVHMLLGALSVHIPVPKGLSWVVWAAVVLAVAHVLASVVTSYEQLGDMEHPPSARKRRHLALKWVTGVLVCALVALHIAHAVPDPIVMAVLAVVVCVHVCTGAKSLLTDLGLNKRYRDAVRVAAIAIAAFAAICVLLGR